MVTGHAYPWDVLGDGAFADRVRAHGIGRVALAACYHSVRAATPLHPRHRLVDAGHTALYRPLRGQVWRGRRLRPATAEWLPEPDPFGTAAGRLRAAGLAVRAWVVLAHDSRLGTAHPNVAVVNCFGEPYPYALCPSRPEVVDYLALLAAEAVRDTDVDQVGLEAAGQLGLVHQGHHDKVDGAYGPTATRLLSVCCCPACRSAWRGGGLAPARVVATLRSEVLRQCAAEDPGPAGESLAGWLPRVLAVRQAAADRLRTAVVQAVRDALPHPVEIVLHAHPDPWATGPSAGLTRQVAGSVDRLLVPCWPAGTAELVTAARAAGLPVDAYVTVLGRTGADQLRRHARELLAAGARELSLYHLGLAPSWRQPLLGRLADLEKLQGAAEPVLDARDVHGRP